MTPPSENRPIVRDRHALVADILIAHSRSAGPQYPWHYSSDTFNWLVAEVLLKRTTRVAARRAYECLLESCSSWDDISSATRGEVASKIEVAGLANQRSRQLLELATKIINDYGGKVPCDKRALLKLPGIGFYSADAVLLYACRHKAFPLDGNVQRVLRRTAGESVLSSKDMPRPRLDSWLTGVSDGLIQRYSADDLQELHRGVLHVGWKTCRPRPRCEQCVLQQVCETGRRILDSTNSAH